MKTKIALCMPCYKSIPINVAKQVMQLPVDSINMIDGCLPYEARNLLAAQTLADESITHVLWLDSDMVWPEDIVQRLLSHNKDIVSALAFRRVPPYNPCIYSNLSPFTPFNNYPSNSLIEVEGAGFGGIMTSTEALRTITNKYNSLFHLVQGYGEDISFCLRAKDARYKIYCDTSVKLGHMGEMIVTEDTFQQYASLTK